MMDMVETAGHEIFSVVDGFDGALSVVPFAEVGVHRTQHLWLDTSRRVR